MKEKLQKCSSSTGSETSEDGGLPPRSVGTKNLSELGKDVGAQNQQNSSQHNVRYLPLNMSLGATSNVNSEFNKSPPPSPASSTSRIQPSTSSASSSSLSSDSAKGLYWYFYPTNKQLLLYTDTVAMKITMCFAILGKTPEKGNGHRSSTDNIVGLSNNTTSSTSRRNRLDDSGNDSGHNSIMTSKLLILQE